MRASSSPCPALAPPRWIPRRPQSWGLILAAVALGAFLWTQFLHSQSQARHRAVVETASRASQIADAVALHADTLVSGIDVAMQYLAGEYPDARPETFENSVRTSIAAFPRVRSRRSRSPTRRASSRTRASA